MNKEYTGRELHAQAATAREEGHFTQALALNDEALLAYDAANNSGDFAEGVANRSITLRVYANKHESRRLLVLAKFEMMAAVAIAQESGNSGALTLPLYNLAQLQEDLHELSEAVVSYQQAIENMSAIDRPALLANMKIHLATCEYKSGDKSALERAHVALTELESVTEESKYTKDVWVSGGYMRLAHILKKDDPKLAQTYLNKAKTIIHGNPTLVLRKEQWDKLAVELQD